MKPINMKTWEVRAILDNRKAVTRRVVKQSIIEKFVISHDNRLLGSFNADHPEWEVYPTVDDAPYHPGDILYVRETFCPYDSDHVINGERYAYKADSTPESERVRKEYGYKWHPSIHMPREAARIFLRVTGVRVERLQEITFSGAIAEGIFWEDVTPDVPSMPDCPAWDMDAVIAEMQEREERELIEKSYGTLWNSNLKPADRALYGWEANPWVWVVEFERISGEETKQ